MVQNSYYLVRAVTRERASVSTYIYIQNRTHDESMMTNGVRAIPQQTGGWRCTGNVKVTTKTWEEKAIE